MSVPVYGRLALNCVLILSFILDVFIDAMAILNMMACVSSMSHKSVALIVNDFREKRNAADISGTCLVCYIVTLQFATMSVYLSALRVVRSSE